MKKKKVICDNRVLYLKRLSHCSECYHSEEKLHSIYLFTKNIFLHLFEALWIFITCHLWNCFFCNANDSYNTDYTSQHFYTRVQKLIILFLEINNNIMHIFPYLCISFFNTHFFCPSLLWTSLLMRSAKHTHTYIYSLSFSLSFFLLFELIQARVNCNSEIKPSR